jgi:two-component system sensor histidine kinase BaeS
MRTLLDAATSIKVKLGALVVVSVIVVALLAILGSSAGVPVWLTLPVAVALTLGVTQLLAAGMVAPLRSMTEVAQRMARGDYSGRVRTTSTDEVGRLAAVFNQMAGDLALVEAERRDLIATVSHELRTPLAAMIAVLENLADGVVPADAQHLDGALAQAERLRRLVTDLLELSRLEAGVTRLQATEVPVRALVTDCIGEVTAAGRTGDFELAIPDDLVARADEARLRQLLVNVFDNAARHAPAGSPVDVAAARTPTGWWLTVTDRGPGVAGHDRERVFQRFGTDATGGGTGLGLAVARWVAQLHGGTLRFTDPDPNSGPAQPGALLRLELPDLNETPAPPEEAAMTVPTPPAVPPAQPGQGTYPPLTPTVGAGVPAPPLGMDSFFGAFWPERPGLPGLRVVVACALVGVLAGATMTFTAPGLSWVLVLVGAGVAAYLTARHRRNAFTIACTSLASLLVLPLMLLDAQGIALLGVFAAAGVFLIGVTDARTPAGFLLSGISWPLSSLRGLPWFGRALRVVGTGGRAPAIVRTVVVSLLALAVFGALFASADALFATWIDALVPTLSFNDLVTRIFVGCLVFAVTLAAAYLALNPSRVEPNRRPVDALGNRFEWLIPVLLVDAVFVLFLVAQATAVFGGHGYVERTTGLTYADYVHQGFGQLTIATLLTLFVVWAAARKVKDAPTDRLWMRLSLGLLCLLTLVVVGSALHRMNLYQEAYGFTTLRLTVDVFEGWLGVVVLLVMVVGGLGHGRWLPRLALVTGAVAVLGLAAMNPDAWVAGRNIDRYEADGKLDIYYLQSLSADAAPVIAERLPADVAVCALRLLPLNQLSEDNDEGLGWNLGRSRAEVALSGLDMEAARPTGAGDPCGPIVDAYAAGTAG